MSREKGESHGHPGRKPKPNNREVGLLSSRSSQSSSEKNCRLRITHPVKFSLKDLDNKQPLSCM